MKRKYILPAAIVLLLLCLAFWGINEFQGNPLSRYLAKRAAASYIKEHYAESNLELKDAYYNFKDGCYGVMAYSATSEDTVFRIYSNSFGKVVGDDYEYEVANCFTTLRRLETELRSIATTTFEGKLPYEADYLNFQFYSSRDLDPLNSLTLDMKLDVTAPPSPLVFNASLFSKTVDIKTLCDILKKSAAIANEANIPVSYYDIVLVPFYDKATNEKPVSWANALSVFDLPSDILTAPDLEEAVSSFIQQAEQNDPKADTE